MDVVKIVRYVFGAVATVLLIGTLIAAQHTRSFLADSVTAQGTVQELVERTSVDSDDRTSTTYAPVVQFVTAEGERRSFVSSTSSNPPAYRVGDTVEVLYSAHDPRQARINGWFSLWGLATILGGLGAVFAAVSGGLTVAALRSRRSSRPGPVPHFVRDVEPDFGSDFGSDVEPDLELDDEPDDEPDDERDVEPDAELRWRGMRVQAAVQQVRPTGTYAPNGSGNYRIVAQWLDPDRHEVQVFTSEDIPFDPTPYLTGTTIDVYIAPDDPSHHYVDVSFLPRPAR